MARLYFAVEYTDTFGGHPNYSWVRRATISVIPPARDNVYTSAAGAVRETRAFRRDVITKAKAAVGLTGCKGKTYWNSAYGDAGIEFKPYGICAILMINPCDEPEESE